MGYEASGHYGEAAAVRRLLLLLLLGITHKRGRGLDKLECRRRQQSGSYDGVEGRREEMWLPGG